MSHFEPSDFTTEDKLMYFPLLISVILNALHFFQTPEFYQMLLYLFQLGTALISFFFGIKKLYFYIKGLLKK